MQFKLNLIAAALALLAGVAAVQGAVLERVPEPRTSTGSGRIVRICVVDSKSAEKMRPSWFDSGSTRESTFWRDKLACARANWLFSGGGGDFGVITRPRPVNWRARQLLAWQANLSPRAKPNFEIGLRVFYVPEVHSTCPLWCISILQPPPCYWSGFPGDSVLRLTKAWFTLNDNRVMSAKYHPPAGLGGSPIRSFGVPSGFMGDAPHAVQSVTTSDPAHEGG
ncbi:hypothetical protein FB45DRAFT_875783 [Roridomyces roridus]|uniref:Uncharacterized protein n=1 Tax=Roridomyces roridus TaxID=1738132 RepID=A0AAD7B5Q1_9AGAR|nr:hypothetical protein FB45DRAFT_875783 [Roridomyces roridus]